MRPPLLTAAIMVIVLLITFAMFASSHRDEQTPTWDAQGALTGTRAVRPGENVVGKWVVFAVPTIVCQTREDLESYLSFMDAGDRKSVESLLVTPDHPIGTCTQMDASNRFWVRNVSVEAAEQASTLELGDGDSELPSLWARSTNVRIFDKEPRG